MNIEIVALWFQVQLEESGYGSDLSSVQAELESHVKVHHSVDQFHSNIEKCILAKVIWFSSFNFQCLHSDKYLIQSLIAVDPATRNVFLASDLKNELVISHSAFFN